MKRILFAVFIVSLCVSSTFAQIGIFDQRADVGDLTLGPGQAAFDNGSYTIDGLGSTIGRRSFSDEFNFVYTEMSGSFSIQGDVFPLFNDGEGGFMIRQSLDTDSQHVSYLRSANTTGGTNADFGTVFPHFRSIKGGGTIVDGDVGVGGFDDSNTGSIRIDRIGNSFYLYTTNAAGEWQLNQTEVIPMEDPVLVGLAATANGAEALGEFEITDVELIEYPLYVSRDLPTDDIQPNSSLSGITVTASARSGQTVDAIVTEVPPADGVASNISSSAGTATLNADGSITWNLSGHSGDATLSYDLALGPRASATWQGVFDDGANAGNYIGGETILPKTPVLTPRETAVDLDADGVTLIQVEEFHLFNPDDEDAFGMHVDPRTNSGVHIIDVGGGSSQILEVEINVPVSGTWWFFGQVRGEDGNSDSWHFEIDLPPLGDNSTRWNIPGNRQISRDWVEQEDPSNDPRPFEIDAGQHFILLANREDSASIDWIAATMDPNIDINQFDDITGSVPQSIEFASINNPNPPVKPMVNGEVFFEAEEGNLIVTPADGTHAFVIFEETGTSNGQYVNANTNPTSNITYDNRLDYTFEVFEAGTYRVIANTRTPTGSDDSFWVEFDGAEIPGTLTIDDAFGGSGIQDNAFHSSWVSSNNIPDWSWELDAGVHTFNIMTREDGTQIDWLIITNDLDQDATVRTPDGGTAVDTYMLY